MLNLYSAAAPRRGRPRLVATTVLATAVAGAAALLAVGSAHAGTVPAGGIAAAYSPSATIESSPPATSPVLPTAPTNVVVTSLTSRTVTLTWTASSPGCCEITGYEVGGTIPFTDVPQGPGASVGNVTTATVQNLIPLQQYSFRVYARDSSGHTSPASAPVTLTAPASDTGDTVPPSQPTNLTLTGATLNWQPSTDNVGVTGYQVYSFDGWYTLVRLATVTGTSYVLPPTATSSPSTPSNPSGPGWTYYVRAVDAAGNVSVMSDRADPPVPPTFPPPPTSPTPSSACAVTYTNVSQWPHGFVANLTIANTGTAPVNGWTLGFSFGGDQRVTEASGATFHQSGAATILRNTNHDAVIRANGSVTVRITGTWHSSNAAPTSFRLNGAPCTTG